MLNPDVVRSLGVGQDAIEQAAAREQHELARREEAYRGTRPPAELEGRTVILVDDGLATGATMRAAIQAVRARHPQRIVVAVPTAPADTAADLEPQVDELICLTTPEPFFGVGGSYQDFVQTTDDEVRAAMAQAAEKPQPNQPHRQGQPDE